MTTVIRRPLAATVFLAAAALLVSACSAGPSQVGAALIVGDTSVSVNQVQHELSDLLATQTKVRQAQQQGTLDQASRSIVTTHVLHVLASRAAGQYSLNVSDQQIDQLINGSGGPDKTVAALLNVGVVTDPANVRDSVRDILVEAALARKFADTMNVQVGYVQAADRAAAVADAQKLAADPNALNGMVAAANAAAAATGNVGGQTSTSLTLSSYLTSVAQQQQQAQSQGQQAPIASLAPIFGAPAGSVITFQPAPTQSPSWIVVLIRSRDTGSGASPGGTSVADSSDLLTLQSVGVSMLQPFGHDLGVRVSPRYGEWNQATMSATAVDDQSVGVELPVRAHVAP